MFKAEDSIADKVKLCLHRPYTSLVSSGLPNGKHPVRTQKP
jgi:hypothetical protein